MPFEICSTDGISLKNKFPVASSLMSLYRPSGIWLVSRSIQGLITLKDRVENTEEQTFSSLPKGMILNLIQITHTEK